MFLAESREHLQNLNLAVIRIEESPDDRDTHRRDLPHRALPEGDERRRWASPRWRRSRTRWRTSSRRCAAGPTRSSTRVADVLLGCLDTLEGALDSIETTGDGGPRRDRARRPARRARGRAGARRPPRPRPPRRRTSGGPAGDGRRPTTATRRSSQIEIALADDVMMPAVRAYMVLAAIADHGEIIHSTPGSDEVDTFDGRRIEAWLVTEHEVATHRGRRPGRPRHRHGQRLGRGADRGGRGRAAGSGAPAAAEAKPAPAAGAACRPGGAIGDDRPRRRRAARSADALHGRARRPPHAASSRSPREAASRA